MFSPAVDKAGNFRSYHTTSGIPANAIVQIRTTKGQALNPNTLGTSDWESSCPMAIPGNMPTIRITGRTEVPSLEIYHAALSPGKWTRTISSIQVFTEGHLDEQLSERKAPPPTGLSYAEFVGMRPRTMSQMFFRTEDGKINTDPPSTEKREKGKKKGKGRGESFSTKYIPVEDV